LQSAKWFRKSRFFWCHHLFFDKAHHLLAVQQARLFDQPVKCRWVNAVLASPKTQESPGIGPQNPGAACSSDDLLLDAITAPFSAPKSIMAVILISVGSDMVKRVS
jgi:hypothetical protein